MSACAPKRNTQKQYLRNIRLARRLWSGAFGRLLDAQLRALTLEYGFAIAVGDLQLLDGRWYVTHSGLLRVAHRRRCRGILVEPCTQLSAPDQNRWTFKATVFTDDDCKGFIGYGDADPSNVSPLVRGAEMRVAETRAVNRALRKAYGIGLCSVEEIGAAPDPIEPAAQARKVPQPAGVNGNGNGQSLRDRLRVIVRQHQLDPALVKAYAADYCGVSELREASREQVEKFVSYLDELARKDRSGLVCLLNSYGQKKDEAAA